MKKNEKIAAVVVTYNRKELLLTCLQAIKEQFHKPDALYIIDNLSTDGTPELLLDNDYIPSLPEDNFNNNNQIIHHKINIDTHSPEELDIIYIRKYENDGGAGGFYEGMKQAYHDGFDWMWIMDDDGIPDNMCLKNLSEYATKGAIDYLAPNLIDKDGISHFSNKFDNSNLDIISFHGGPFNGILLSNELIHKIGLPIRKFFIWGDEMEYINRISENGFTTVTVKNALHKHKRTGFRYKSIPRVYYYTRNLIYINRLFKGVYRSKFIRNLGCILTISKIILYSILYFKFNQLKNCIKGIIDGCNYDILVEQEKSIHFE